MERGDTASRWWYSIIWWFSTTAICVFYVFMAGMILLMLAMLGLLGYMISLDPVKCWEIAEGLGYVVIGLLGLGGLCAIGAYCEDYMKWYKNVR